MRGSRAAGDPRRAMRSLELASEQRRSATGGGLGAPVRTAAVSDNPFRSGSTIAVTTVAPSDPLAAEIAREAQRLRDETASQIAFAPGVRTRSGSSGLDRLTEIGASVEARLPAAGGAVTVRATPVTIDAGSIDRDVNTNRRYGTNALAGPTGGPVPRNVTHFVYQRNLRYFTLNHGGYFSPQSYTALTVPVDWRGVRATSPGGWARASVSRPSGKTQHPISRMTAGCRRRWKEGRPATRRCAPAMTGRARAASWSACAAISNTGSPSSSGSAAC
jgi:hypothetical protein